MRSLRSLFARQLQVQQRLHNFVTALENRLLDNGQWELSPAQPTRIPYEYTDDETGELIRLWRTPEDVVRQDEYQKYRLVLDRGIKAVMDDELFKSKRKDQEHDPVRAYNILRLISRGLTELICGGGITLELGIEELDAIIEDIKLKRDLQRWSFEASVFGFVGVETKYDVESEALAIVRVFPDYLYPVRDPESTDKLLYVSKKTRIPLEQYPDWEPVTLESETMIGTTEARPLKRKDKKGVIGKHEAGGQPLEQDAFVLEERHYPGWIEHYFYATVGDRIICDVPLEIYDPDLARCPVHFTGMRSHAIQILGNTNDEGEWVSDWKDLLDPVVDFCERATKNKRLVDRFSAPREMVPQTMISVDPFTGKANYRSDPDDVIVIRPTDKIKPEFLQPNADMTGPQEDLNFVRSMIAILSSMGHVIDPEIKERLLTGVALKLHMAPALARVNPLIEERQDVVRTVLFNLMGAIEYFTAQYHPASADRSPQQEEAYVNAEFAEWRGALSEMMLDDLRRQAQFRGGNYIKIDKLAPLFTHIELEDPHAESQRGVTFADPSQAVLQDGQLMQPNGSPFPDVLGEDELNRAAAAVDAVDSIVRLKEQDIVVRFASGLPQDEAAAAEEVQNGLMSLRRFLTDFKGMTDAEAEKEIQRIREDQQNTLVSSDFGDAGYAEPEEPQPDPVAENEEFTEAQRLAAAMDDGPNPQSDRLTDTASPVPAPIV